MSFDDRTKKIILIVLFLVSIVVFAALIYFLFFRPLVSPVTEQGTSGQQASSTGGLPSANEGAPTAVQTPEQTQGAFPEADEVARGGVTEITTLTTARVENPTLASDGSSMRFYDPADGHFYTIDKQGNIQELSAQTFPEAETVKWNNDAQKAVIEFPDGSNVIYDFDEETQVTLPTHWEDFEFSPVSDELLSKSLGLDPQNRWLVITNDSGTNTKTFQELGDNGDKVQVNWSPNDQVVAFADTATSPQGSLDRQMIYPVGKNKENFKGLIVEGFGFDARWSPNGKQLLYSVSGTYSDYKPLLWLVDATPSTMGENRHSLTLNTWVDKCTWNSNEFIYCAAPQNLPSSAGLGRSLYETYPDAVYRIDVKNNQTTLVAIPDVETTLTNLFVSSDGTLLYFQNKQTGLLQFLRLK